VVRDHRPTPFACELPHPLHIGGVPREPVREVFNLMPVGVGQCIQRASNAERYVRITEEIHAARPSPSCHETAAFTCSTETLNQRAAASSDCSARAAAASVSAGMLATVGRPNARVGSRTTALFGHSGYQRTARSSLSNSICLNSEGDTTAWN